MSSLLAVDLGLRTGLSLYGADGRLRWYRSQNYGSRSRLKRGAYGLMQELTDVSHLVVEGGGDLAAAWEKEAGRHEARFVQVDAHTWRRELFFRRHRRSGSVAKEHADAMARRVIAWSGAAAPTSLRHDAAEAILVGLWGVLQVGWLGDLPEAVTQG